MKYNFNKKINRKKTSCFKWDHRKKIFGTEDILPFNVSDMDFAIPKIVQKALRKRLKHPVLGYTMRTDDFFKSLTSWLKKRYHWEVENDSIIPIHSIVPSIYSSIQGFTEPGDGIIVQPPVYNPFAELILSNNRKVLYNELIANKIDHRYKIYYSIDFDDFEEKAKQAKLFLFCSPHNPVGRVWTHIELEKIGNICKKHNVKIFSDEAHSDLVFKRYKHIPFGSLKDFHDMSVTAMSPSKSFNIGGLNTSMLIIPNPEIRKQMEEMLKRIGFIGSDGAVFSNVIGLKALEICYSKCEDWLEALNEHLDSNRQYIHDFIENEIPQLKISDSESLYMAWIDFSALGLRQWELEDFMINKAKLGLVTGTKFGENGLGFMRMNFACSRKVLEKAMLNLKKEIDKINRR
ncbi:MAG: PatB family C-S lyase [Candidatus Cloacimonetes bacterium]|nr:PatB family C-S lyase [Candidatus Cloacimonadota bacterium]